jgi:hypothetical protein
MGTKVDRMIEVINPLNAVFLSRCFYGEFIYTQDLDGKDGFHLLSMPTMMLGKVWNKSRMEC